MRPLATALPLLASLYLLSACSGGEALDESAAARLELLTWWREPRDVAALDALLAVHAEQHPGARVTVLASGARATMLTDLQARLASGTAPTAFQETLGGKVRAWAANAQPLDPYAGEWLGAYDPVVIDLVKADGKLIGVPLAITRQNDAYYNLRVLGELGMGIPEGNEGFLQWLEELAQKGYEHPLCIGDEDNWVSAQVLFDDIVPAYAGAEFTRGYWSGMRSRGDVGLLVEALDFAEKIVRYFNTDLADIDMPLAVQRLMEEREPAQQCVMAPVLDWGGALLDATFKVNQDFAQTTWPGTENIFVLAGDAFIMARGASSPESAYALFDTMASRDGQIAFNSVKGSIPARIMDAEDLDAFGPLTRSNMLDLASGTTVPAFEVLGNSGSWWKGTVSAGFPWQGLYELTHDFFLTGDSEPVVEYLRQHYDRLVQ